MKFFRGGALFIGLLGVAGATQAGVTSTWTATNDYDFRGNSQSSKDPALQASIDYAHDSGWYVGAWASNIDFAVDESAGTLKDPSIELDLYSGFTKTMESGYTWDAGLVYYTYPDESDFNYFEVYASIAKDWFKGKVWYSPKFAGNAAEDLAQATVGKNDVSAWYIEANGTFPLPHDFSITAHVGYSAGDYWDNAFGDKQLDYAVGVGYTYQKFAFGLKFVDTDSNVVVKSDAFNNEGRVIFTVATTFPWGE
jgi:uncharacterized protein (TIGR02001 family)